MLHKNAFFQLMRSNHRKIIQMCRNIQLFMLYNGIEKSLPMKTVKSIDLIKETRAMKRFYLKGVIFFLLVMFLSSVGSAETKYVGELLKITLRSGKGTDQKILSMVESGEMVDVLETGKEWSLVRLSNGKEGWVLDRFLTTKEPCSYELNELKEKQKTIATQIETLFDENKKLKAENEKLNSLPKTDVAEYQKLKKEYSDLLERYKEESLKLETLENSTKKDFFRQNVMWFLSGAGVLIIGFIIGFSAKRQRRRPYLS